MSDDLGYSYAQGLNMRPDSPDHQKLVKEVYTRALESSNEMSKRYESWKKVDKTLTAYVKLDESEKGIKDVDNRRPVSIVVPYSYATLETILTYFTTAFLESPIFRYEGSSPEDIVGAILMEKVIDQHVQNFKVALNLHTMFRDSLSYGLGVVSPTWDRKWGWKAVVQDSGFMSSLFAKFISTGPKRDREETILYEGNRLKNIDPYRYLPDPNVPIHDVQQGEFVGWIESTNYMKLIELEKNDPDVFNVKYLKGMTGNSGKSQFNKSRSESGRSDRFNLSTQMSGVSTSPIDVVWMYWTLIPKDQRLGGSEYPEKWLIGLAADKVIICAKQLSLNHDMYPVAVCAPDYDGYSSTPVSRLELMYGMQEALDWLFNCYDDKTEVLTERGWVFLSETLQDDRVATVDPITRELWFENPKQWFSYDYNGYLLNFKSSRMDMCVTPNHNMFAKKRSGFDWSFITAINLALQASDEYKTIGNLNWSGESASSISFEAIRPIRDRGKELRYEDIKINPMVLAGFLGWFLSEGSISHGKSSGSYSIVIKQSKKDHMADINSLMKSMPFHVTVTYDEKKDATQWTITDKRFYAWLKENCYNGGTTGEFKKIPDCVRNWDEFHLNLLFERAMWGDGSWMSGHENLGTYGSKSKELVDNMQEIAIRLGYFSHVRESLTPNGLPFYILNISTAETNPTISTRNCHRVKYNGKVYCFENSTHLTVTRRNGKVAIQGQSHISNVRKAINDMLIVDPSLINMQDLEDPRPGKLIRMRRAAWGRGVENAVKQLQVSDITKSHISDAASIIDYMQRTSAATDSLSGMVRKTGERVTAEETKSTRSSALSRLTKAAKIASLQAMRDIGYMFAVHTQQMMKQDTYIKAVGQWPDVLMQEYVNANARAGRVKVTPFDLIVDYDIVIKDGSVQGSEYADSWIEVFRVLTQQPILFQSFDMVRIFKHIARIMGAKDINEFVMQNGIPPAVNAQVMGQDTIDQGVQQGNVVPIEQMPAMGGR
jgi:hypothetical protein